MLHRSVQFGFTLGGFSCPRGGPGGGSEDAEISFSTWGGSALRHDARGRRGPGRAKHAWAWRQCCRYGADQSPRWAPRQRHRDRDRRPGGPAGSPRRAAARWRPQTLARCYTDWQYVWTYYGPRFLPVKSVYRVGTAAAGRWPAHRPRCTLRRGRHRHCRTAVPSPAASLPRQVLPGEYIAGVIDRAGRPDDLLEIQPPARLLHDGEETPPRNRRASIPFCRPCPAAASVRCAAEACRARCSPRAVLAPIIRAVRARRGQVGRQDLQFGLAQPIGEAPADDEVEAPQRRTSARSSRSTRFSVMSSPGAIFSFCFDPACAGKDRRRPSWRRSRGKRRTSALCRPGSRGPSAARGGGRCARRASPRRSTGCPAGGGHSVSRRAWNSGGTGRSAT